MRRWLSLEFLGMAAPMSDGAKVRSLISDSPIRDRTRLRETCIQESHCSARTASLLAAGDRGGIIQRTPVAGKAIGRQTTFGIDPTLIDRLGHSVDSLDEIWDRKGPIKTKQVMQDGLHLSPLDIHAAAPTRIPPLLFTNVAVPKHQAARRPEGCSSGQHSLKESNLPG